MFLALCALRLLLRGQGGALGDALRKAGAAIGLEAVLSMTPPHAFAVLQGRPHLRAPGPRPVTENGPWPRV
jgi:hypothetical protein